MDRLAAACEARGAHVPDQPKGKGWVCCVDCGVPWSGRMADRWRYPTADGSAGQAVSAGDSRCRSHVVSRRSHWHR
jgi:hypothetical protein